ncbi:hypothetical protein AFCDBAGC_1278 [Methylobacterium cerastii]|uniref:DNA-directed RNA polymerase II n=1 Tax=Methylobacterium cerastii TaxID=932741 RepID=A0ABQ4QDY4_9HYPH|nr:hypothetical protein AFCDBAGC_1278 [Methylobacterium cerastii]
MPCELAEFPPRRIPVPALVIVPVLVPPSRIAVVATAWIVPALTIDTEPLLRLTRSPVGLDTLAPARLISDSPVPVGRTRPVTVPELSRLSAPTLALSAVAPVDTETVPRLVKRPPLRVMPLAEPGA